MYIYMYIYLYICIYISDIYAPDSGGISISLSSFFPLGSQILHISETLIRQVFNNQGASWLQVNSLTWDYSNGETGQVQKAK